MDYTKLSLTNCINLACSEFGLENPHTIAIARLVDLVKSGYLAKDEATTMALKVSTIMTSGTMIS